MVFSSQLERKHGFLDAYTFSDDVNPDRGNGFRHHPQKENRPSGRRGPYITFSSFQATSSAAN
jgi:hypothetical protein